MAALNEEKWCWFDGGQAAVRVQWLGKLLLILFVKEYYYIGRLSARGLVVD